MNRPLRIVNGKQSVDEAIEAPVEELKREEAEKVREAKQIIDQVIRRASTRPKVVTAKRALDGLAILYRGDMRAFTKAKETLSTLPGVDWGRVKASLFGEKEEVPEKREAMPIYECPDILWQGRFAELSKRLGGRRSWEIWSGLYAALSATVSRQINMGYFSNPIMGTAYILLIKHTGGGKTEGTNTCEAALPGIVVCASGVQSGAGLLPLLADFGEEKGIKGVIRGRSHPTLLVIDEWTTFIKNAGINNSTLGEDANSLWHRWSPWSQNKGLTTGGRREVPEPALSIYGTTTLELLKSTLTRERIYSGFINRYLILPGTQRYMKFHDPSWKPLQYQGLRGKLNDLQATEPWRETDVMNVYEANAKRRIVEWAEKNLERYLNENSLEASALRRLPVYLHQIALIYAWSEGKRKVSLNHVEASIAVCHVAKEFTLWVLEQPVEVEAPYHRKYDEAIKEAVIKAVEQQPGIPKRQLIQKLKGRNRGSSVIVEAIDQLLRHGVLRPVEKAYPGGTSLELYLR